ncbi:MAG TPA: P-loop NTPase [Steroidobacteraceae bacterium]|nr:P-loop NTPase [Steroidobacteraceae bacterium]
MNRVRIALEAYVDPYLGETLGTAQAVEEVRAAGTGFSARIALGFPVGGYQAELQGALVRQLATAGVAAPLAIELRSHIRSHAVQRNLKPLGEIRNVVAVASGKGGVGKSTVAVNLALAWAGQGARVGILDADIYGPSQPLMLGLTGQRPSSPDGKRLRPLASHGISAMSIGFRWTPSSPWCGAGRW